MIVASAGCMLFGAMLAVFAKARWQPSSAATANSIAAMLNPAIAGAAAFRTVVEVNSRTALVIACGFMTFGLSSAVALTVATALSVFQIISMTERAIPVRLVLASLLPHAPVECAGFCLIGAAGLSGAPALRAACQGRFDVVRRVGIQAWRLASIGYVLVVLAAAVEAFLTPFAMKMSVR